jgi:hypothetical protein
LHALDARSGCATRDSTRSACVTSIYCRVELVEEELVVVLPFDELLLDSLACGLPLVK